jgi:hypothetical protein
MLIELNESFCMFNMFKKFMCDFKYFVSELKTNIENLTDIVLKLYSNQLFVKNRNHAQI